MAFIRAVVEGRLELRNVARNVLVDRMHAMNFIKYSCIPRVESTKLATFKEENKDNQDEDEDNGDNQHDYDYLLKMPLWSLTLEKV